MKGVSASTDTHGIPDAGSNRSIFQAAGGNHVTAEDNWDFGNNFSRTMGVSL